MRESDAMRLVMSSTHLIDRDSLVRSIEHTKKLGFWGIEIFGNEIVSGNLTELSALDEVRVTAEEHSLAITVHPWFDWTDRPEAEAADQLGALLQRCARLGALYVNIHLNFIATPDQGVERVANVVRLIEDDLDDIRLTLCFENVPATLANPLGAHPKEFSQFFALVENISSLALTIDTGHAHISGNLEAFVSELSSRWAYTHITDNFGTEDEHLGAGAGNIDWDGFVQGLVLSGYDGPLVMEFNERFLPESQETLAKAFSLQECGWHQLRVG